MISLALIEDNHLVREGMTAMLNQTDDFRVVAARYRRVRKRGSSAGVSESREMRRLREENAELKQMVANLLLKKKRAAHARAGD